MIKGSDGIYRVVEFCWCSKCVLRENTNPKQETLSPVPTPWAICCSEHGKVYISNHAYKQQYYKQEWICPLCNTPAIWDDANHQSHLEAV